MIDRGDRAPSLHINSDQQRRGIGMAVPNALKMVQYHEPQRIRQNPADDSQTAERKREEPGRERPKKTSR